MTSYTELIRQIYTENGMRGFYRGYWAMFWRDVPWYGIYFYTFDFLSKLWIKEGDSNLVINFKKSMACGIAGIVNWLPSYPIDVIKSTMQTH